METILASMTYGPSRQVSSPTICWEWSIRPLVKSGSAFSVWSTPADISNSIYSYCAFTESSVCCSTQSARLTFYFFCTVRKTWFERVCPVELRVNNNRYMECHHHRFHENYAVHSLGIHVIVSDSHPDAMDPFDRNFTALDVRIHRCKLRSTIRRISFLGVVYVILLVSAVISFPFFLRCVLWVYKLQHEYNTNLSTAAALSKKTSRFHVVYKPWPFKFFSLVSLRFLFNSRKWTQMLRCCWRLKDGSYNFHEGIHHIIISSSCILLNTLPSLHSNGFHSISLWLIRIQTRLHDFDGWHLFAPTRKRRYNDSAME
jgi:hypothetical protein